MYGPVEAYKEHTNQVFVRGRFRLEIILTEGLIWIKTTKQFGPVEGKGLHETLVCDVKGSSIFHLVSRLADTEVPMTLVARRDINFPIGCKVQMKVRNKVRK